MTTQIEPRQAQELRQRSFEHPETWFTDVLGVQPFDKQIEVVESVRDNRRTAVVGCNAGGKDWITGRIILWWLTVHNMAKVIVYGPTLKQVRDVVWVELRGGYIAAHQMMGGRLYDKTARLDIHNEKWALGFATDDPMNIQGFHSPHLLVVVTEAHAVSKGEYEALHGLQPERIILTGNALTTSGEFYDALHIMRGLYFPIKIAAGDTPNLRPDEYDPVPGMITQQVIDEYAETYGTDSAMYKARILAEFSDATDDVLVTLAWADAAMKRELEATGEAVYGVDVGREGDDPSVIYRRQGPVARKVWIAKGRTTLQVAGEVMRLVNDDPDARVAVIDDVGVGGGVTDALRAWMRDGQMRSHMRIEAFKGGERARDHTKYRDRNAESWWTMRRAFAEGMIDLGDDRALIAQVTTRRWEPLPDGRLALEKKSLYKARVRTSPDEADALAMTYSPGMSSTRPAIITEKKTSINADR